MEHSKEAKDDLSIETCMLKGKSKLKTELDFQTMKHLFKRCDRFTLRIFEMFHSSCIMDPHQWRYARL
jgi:hypothetical protein